MRHSHQAPKFTFGLLMLCMLMAGCISSQQQVVGREIIGRDGSPMVLVPAGEFLYGDNNQRISLPAFYMDQYEVTTKRYAKFLQATGREQPKYWNEVSLARDGDRPVVWVTWNDADAYCRWAGKRLPTEQEWEKAARGTDGRMYPWGNSAPSSALANYGEQKLDLSGNLYERLKPVGSYEAGKSPYGIYDMAGNVWELTSSDFDNNNKVIRGGSWITGSMRATERAKWPPTVRDYQSGFRCAQGSPQ